MTEDEAWLALERLDPLWEELFPAEQARIIHLLVDRVDIRPDGADACRAVGRIDEGGSMTSAAQMLTVRVPLAIRKRGGRKLVVTPVGTMRRGPSGADSTLVKALARAFR